MSQGWNSKVKPEQRSSHLREWLWPVQGVVQTVPCCFTLPAAIPIPQQPWECCPRRLEGGRAKLTEKPATGDTPQVCLPQQQDPFSLREMILTKVLLTFRLVHRSAKDTALRRQVLQVMLIPGERISSTILDAPCNSPGQTKLVFQDLLSCSVAGPLQMQSWMHSWELGGEDSTSQGAPEETGARQN